MRIALATAALLLVAAAPDITPIQFARGASSAVVSGAAERGGRALYGFTARAGQRMILSVSAVENNAVFQVYRPGFAIAADDIAGATLPGAGVDDDAAKWSGKLPVSGRYLIVVGPTRGNATYKLKLTI